MSHVNPFVPLCLTFSSLCNPRFTVLKVPYNRYLSQVDGQLDILRKREKNRKICFVVDTLALIILFIGCCPCARHHAQLFGQYHFL